MILILSVITLIFIIYIIIFFIFFKPENISTQLKPNKISVVVAARNESNNIAGLIDSLSAQSYSKELFEVIIVDDNSTDNTFNQAVSLSKERTNFRVLKTRNNFLSGKRAALKTGIEASKYPFILITDADCKPQEKWIEIMNAKFNEGYDFIFGLAPFSTEKTFTNKLARFENLWTHILTFSFAKAGIPYSAAARNFGFKKSSFVKTGGYDNTTETLSGDDDLLLREAVKHKMKIDCVTDYAASVFSRTPSTYTAYLKQKARHTSTSHHYLLKHQILLGIWHIANLLLLSSIFFVGYSYFFLFLFCIKFFFDGVLVLSKQKITNYNFSILEILYLQTLYDLHIVVNFINSFFLKRNWKSDS